MRFFARHIGSGLWGVWDSAVASWKATDLGEIEARQKAMDLDVVYNRYGQRTQAERRQVSPPALVESAAWRPAGELDFWVLERGEWWGRVRSPDGTQAWVRAADLRRTGDSGR